MLLCHPHCDAHQDWGVLPLPPPWCQAESKSLHPELGAAPVYSSSIPGSESRLNVNTSKMKPG